MADNVGYTQGDGTKIASRGVTYSGDLVQAQVVGLATFTGADDAKIITDIGTSNPLPITAPGGIAVTGALTDAELRAAAVPVSDEDVARLLVRVLNLLGAPVNYDPALNRQRMTAILESGTLTTVGTLTDITNFGAGRTATELQNNQALATWASCHASRVF